MSVGDARKEGDDVETAEGAVSGRQSGKIETGSATVTGVSTEAVLGFLKRTKVGMVKEGAPAGRGRTCCARKTLGCSKVYGPAPGFPSPLS